MQPHIGQRQAAVTLRRDCPLECIQAIAGMKRQRGVSMIELIMFIVIISIAVAGILLVMNNVSGHSADALVRKQALAVAESLLEEIELQDFISASGVTACPPNPTPDPVTPANRAIGYHIVCDYNGLNMPAGITDMNGVAVMGLENYRANVVVEEMALGSGAATIAAGSAVLITVNIFDPQNNQIQISGYRTAY